MTKRIGVGVYLGKSGKIYGPYERVEFDQLVSDGKLGEYHWIWDTRASQWKPTEPPPPPPVSEPGAGTGTLHRDWSTVQAVCFDNSHLVGGTLNKITEIGCRLVSNQSGSGTLFPMQSRIKMNLFNTTSEVSSTTSVTVTVHGLRYEDQHWIYDLRWDQLPEL